MNSVWKGFVFLLLLGVVVALLLLSQFQEAAESIDPDDRGYGSVTVLENTRK
jgi:hypothetical protein